MSIQLESQSISFDYGGHEITLETGKVARQATAAVITSVGKTRVLTTVVANKKADPLKDFFPLAVFIKKNFMLLERFQEVFQKRARPTEAETLTSRLIDRPIRPLFPDNFKMKCKLCAQCYQLILIIPQTLLL